MNQPVVFIRGNKTGTNYDEERKKKTFPFIFSSVFLPSNKKRNPKGDFVFPNPIFFLSSWPYSTIFFADFLAYEQLMFRVRFFTTFLCWFSPCSIWKLLFSVPTQEPDVCAEFLVKMGCVFLVMFEFFLWCLSFRPLNKRDVWSSTL